MTEIEKFRNIAIVAHVDAGKTTLSERLLYFSRSIQEMGEVDEGNSAMDNMPEEQQMGITIETGVATYNWKNHKVTFLDTPGHVDFEFEVDSAMRGCEGAVLIISGKRGVETQTLAVWNKLIAKGIQPLVFINKGDLPGQESRAILREIQERLNCQPFLMTIPVFSNSQMTGIFDVLNGVTLYSSKQNLRNYTIGKPPAYLHAQVAEARSRLFDIATEEDSELTEDYILEKEVSVDRLIRGIRRSLSTGRFLPVYQGSALKNIGVRQLMNGINFFIPKPGISRKRNCLAQILKVKYLDDWGRLYILKLHAGIDKQTPFIESLYKIQAESLQPIEKGYPGEILAAGLKIEGQAVELGGWLMGNGTVYRDKTFVDSYGPLIQTHIEAIKDENFDRVNKAARQLADIDPSIQLTVNAEGGNWLLSTVGEVQLEIFLRKLKKLSCCKVKTGLPQVKLLERLKKPHKGLKNTAESGNTSLKVEMDIFPANTKKESRIENLSNLKSPEYTRIFSSIHTQICERGVAGVGSLTGLIIIIKSISSTTGEYPVPLLNKVLFDCFKLFLSEKSVDILEPIMNLQIYTPESFCGAITADLESKAAVIKKIDPRAQNIMILSQLPLQRIFGYASLLRSLSKGQGTCMLVYLKHGKKI